MTRGVLRPLLLLAIATMPLHAQERVRQEFGFTAMSALRDPALVAGGVSVGVRPGGNARVVVHTVVGGISGQTVARGELLAQFLLNPRQQRGVSPYGFGGVAGETGGGSRGYLVIGLGVESAPGRTSGWAVEAGAGGGVRLAAGWRWRW